jgi:Ca2+/H+ antiporter, TMEM165/GDT1 family
LRVSTSLDRAMETYLVSAALVALAEMGDRTQLLAVMLASRFRKPVPILAGILVATIANHALAALAGFYLSSLLSAVWFKYAVSLSFIAMAAWALIPDKAGDDDDKPRRAGWGVFLTTLVSFFLVEMGDKTQIATAALAARFHDVILVASGTTTGMMLANIPAVFLGHGVTRVLPINALRIAAAMVYLGLGVWGLAATAGWVR